MKSEMIRGVLLGLVAIALGLGAMFWGQANQYNIGRVSADAIETTGTVTSVAQSGTVSDGDGSSGVALFRIGYAFTTEEGEEITGSTTRDDQGSMGPILEEGDSIDIRYAPSRPENHLPAHREAQTMWVILRWLGLAIAIAGGAVLVRAVLRRSSGGGNAGAM